LDTVHPYRVQNGGVSGTLSVDVAGTAPRVVWGWKDCVTCYHWREACCYLQALCWFACWLQPPWPAPRGSFSHRTESNSPPRYVGSRLGRSTTCVPGGVWDWRVLPN